MGREGVDLIALLINRRARRFRAIRRRIKCLHQKKTIPNATEGKTVAHILAINKHAMEQIEAGHYRIENASISQSKNADGSVRLNGVFDRYETDPSVEAQPHGLDLS